MKFSCASSLSLITALAFLLVPALSPASAADAADTLTTATCEGAYPKHLQGICTDGKGHIFWSFSERIVKTDGKGTILLTVEAPWHQGDLCYSEGRIFVAVNLGKFNQPPGAADSWVYVYDSETLTLLEKHEVQEAVHGAGGMDIKDGHYFVIGGLPTDTPVNYVFEYDENFKFVKRHVIESGWTLLGIQTAAWHDGAWWFGCYGKPEVLLKTDANFKLIGRYEFSCAVGIMGIAPNRFLVAKNVKLPEKKLTASLSFAKADKDTGLVRENP